MKELIQNLKQIVNELENITILFNNKIIPINKINSLNIHITHSFNKFTEKLAYVSLGYNDEDGMWHAIHEEFSDDEALFARYLELKKLIGIK